MSIKDIRIQKEINRIIKNYLSDGTIPTSSEVIGALSRYIHDNNLEIPSYDYQKMYPKNFTGQRINQAKEFIARDIEVIYRSLLDIYLESRKQIEKFESEKKKAQYEVNKLEGHLSNLLLKHSLSGYSDTFIESMADMQRVNLAESTCDIDLQNQEATLNKLQDKLYTDYREIKSTFTSSDVRISSTIPQAMDKPGIYWEAMAHHKKQERSTCTIHIDLGRDVPINKTELVMPLLKDSALEVSTSRDKDQWETQFSGVIKSRLIVNTSGSFRFMKITLTKEEADKVVDNDYVYYFIIDTLRLFQVNYARRSEFVSLPVSFKSNINKLTLKERALRPNSTDIKYYISLNTPIPQWIPIDPVNRKTTSNNQVINFHTIEEGNVEDIFLPSDISNEAHRLMTVNGQNIYSILSMNHGEITNHRLYKGINSWCIDEMSYSVIKAGPLDKTIFLENSSFVNTSYRSIQIGKLLSLHKVEPSNSSVLKLATTVECPSGIKPIKAQLVSNFPITVYLNGTILYRGTPGEETHVIYPFTEGKNYLEAIINVQNFSKADGSAATEAVYASADLNINLAATATHLYAHPDPMKHVTFFDLKHNSNNRKDVYTLQKTNEGYEILVKDDDLQIGYRLNYDYVIEPVREILVRAEMSREYSNINITPRLSGYEIQIM